MDQIVPAIRFKRGLDAVKTAFDTFLRAAKHPNFVAVHGEHKCRAESHCTGSEVANIFDVLHLHSYSSFRLMQHGEGFVIRPECMSAHPLSPGSFSQDRTLDFQWFSADYLPVNFNTQ
jgi:hypothetical protein